MPIKIDFADWGPNYTKENNYFYRLLKRHFKVELCSRPDFLIYSHDGSFYKLHTGVRIFATVEAIRPNFNECDHAITCFRVDDERHLRIPYYVWISEPGELIRQPDEIQEILPGKQKFCSFVVGSRNPRKRIDFFQKLSKYKQVDSGGKLLNNIGGPIPGYSRGKVEFLKPYKFNIAFENAAVPDYTTEKIYEAMAARCVPIYWGDPKVGLDFNPQSFLNRSDFATDEQLIQRIIALDQNPNEYRKLFEQPYFHHNRPSEVFDEEKTASFFDRIFTSKEKPIGQRKKFFFARWTVLRANRRNPWPPNNAQ